MFQLLRRRRPLLSAAAVVFAVLYATELAAQTPDHLTVEGSRFLMVEDAGHFLHLEQPAEVNRLILGYLT